MKRILWALIALCFVTPALADLTFPDRQDKAVVDAAHVLNPSAARSLNAQLTAWEKATHHQLVVATVPSLEGQTIAEYGVQLGRHWRLGQTGIDDGVILLVAPFDHKVSIAVGRGLEPVLTDAASQQIVHNTVLPLLKAHQMDSAVAQGSDAIMSYVNAHEGDMLQPTPVSHSHGEWGWLIIAVSVLIGVIGAIWSARRHAHKSLQAWGEEPIHPQPRFTPDPSYSTSYAPQAQTSYDYTRQDGMNNYRRPYGSIYPSDPTPPVQQSSGMADFVEGAVVGAVVDHLFEEHERREERDRFDDTAPSSNDTSYFGGGSDNVGFSSSNSDDNSFGGGGADDQW